VEAKVIEGAEAMIRNPDLETEYQKFAAKSLAVFKAANRVKEMAMELRFKHKQPEDANVNPATGAWQAPREIQPGQMAQRPTGAKLDSTDRDAFNELVERQLDTLDEKGAFYKALRKECGAPYYSQLDHVGQWFTMEDNKKVLLVKDKKKEILKDVSKEG